MSNRGNRLRKINSLKDIKIFLAETPDAPSSSVDSIPTDDNETDASIELVYSKPPQTAKEQEEYKERNNYHNLLHSIPIGNFRCTKFNNGTVLV